MYEEIAPPEDSEEEEDSKESEEEKEEEEIGDETNATGLKTPGEG
jgi:hypothetical protein